MTSQMVGLPKSGPQSYELTVKYALRITNSGEFLHSALWSAGYLGRQSASHGRIGMSEADAGRLYQNAPSGSPVVVSGTSRSLDPLNGLWRLARAGSLRPTFCRTGWSLAHRFVGPCRTAAPLGRSRYGCSWSHQLQLVRGRVQGAPSRNWCGAVSSGRPA